MNFKYLLDSHQQSVFTTFRDFIRLGKWFVQPYDYPAPRFDPNDNDDHNSPDAFTPPPPTANHLSFSFAFFVHGESSVCASVDVRQHPSVRRLTRWHMQEAQAITGGIKGTCCVNIVHCKFPYTGA